MSDLRELYQEVILDHNRHPRNFGTLTDHDRDAEGYNPLCGDRITVRVKLDGDRIADIRFEGSGCAISTASASVMTETLKGKTLEEAKELFERFHDLVTGKADGEANLATLGKLAVFGGVSEFPVRVKCATLCWHTTQAALDKSGQKVTTE
jgi:nitrogen fixation NifU-like protein